jgi:outer membrane translocation and assembly module TamA
LNGLDPNTLFAHQSYFGGKLMLDIDTRKNKLFPHQGIVWTTSLRHLSGMNDASNNVTQFNSDFSFYLQLSKGIILADRFGGGHNWGDFEFFHAQYLGSEEHLRGYRKTRFAGRSKLYNDLELRMKLGNFQTYFFPGSWGILLFSDNGRVWVDNVTTTKWANGYGGGLWFAPLNRLIVSVSYTASKEDKLPLVGLGWRF